MTIEPIAYFRSPLKGKFGLPRQAGLAPSLRGEIVLIPPYDAAEAVRGLDGFEYCWLIWGFSMSEGKRNSMTVRPPRLGGNERVGVFASRSPFRPNGLGLSCVRIESLQPGRIVVSGADLADRTPVYDIKPYISYADSFPSARCGFVDSTEWKPLRVEIPASVTEKLGGDIVSALSELLSQDPRPQYQDDSERVYGLNLDSFDIKFKVSDGTVFVLSAEKY